MNSWSGPRFPVGENSTEAHPLETVALWALGAVVAIGGLLWATGQLSGSALQRVVAPSSRFGDGVSRGADFRGTLATPQELGLRPQAC